MLNIVRGAREVARARENRKRSSKTSAVGHSNPKQNKRLSRVPGQVGVAVRRDDSSRHPLPAFDSSHVERDRQDDQHEYHAFGGGTTGQSTANLRQASPHIYSRPEDAGPLAVDDTDYSPAAEDLTVDSPEPERTRAKTVKPSGAFAHPGQRLGSSSGAGGGGQSLGSWLLPEPSPKAASKRSNDGRRRQRPLQSATDNSEDFPRGTRTWGAFAQGQDRSRAGGNSLSTWLEPLPSMATSRKDRRTEPKSGEMSEGAAAEGYESSGGQADDEYAYDDDDETSNDGVDGNAKWMSDRLEGLDPSGAARAKDSWTDRERRNLTSTDVALGTKRKGRGRGGWRTKAGSKVFVASGRGGSVVASGQAAFKISKGGGGKKRKIG
ncbi:unnamed protein product [Pylaiella littoralis]